MVLAKAPKTVKKEASGSTAAPVVLPADEPRSESLPAEPSASLDQQAPSSLSRGFTFYGGFLQNNEVGNLIALNRIYGIDYYFSLSPEWQLGAGILMSYFDLRKINEDIAQAHPLAWVNGLAPGSVGLGLDIWARVFLGESFYLKSGLQQLETHTNYGYGDSTCCYNGLLSSSTTMLRASIGNQWAIGGGLTFGVEWIGFLVPINSVTSNKPSDSTSTQAAQDSAYDLKGRIERSNRQTTLSIFNIGVGYSF